MIDHTNGITGTADDSWMEHMGTKPDYPSAELSVPGLEKTAYQPRDVGDRIYRVLGWIGPWKKGIYAAGVSVSTVRRKGDGSLYPPRFIAYFAFSIYCSLV